MKINVTPCYNCPFTDGRDQYATDAMMRDAKKRIENGERWICHNTCSAGGRVSRRSRYCAAAPQPTMAERGKGSAT